MIPKILGVFLCFYGLQSVYGAAYSNVYIQSGEDVVPVEYLKYGAPGVVTNTQIAALSAPPIGSVLPLQNVLAPCVAPCIVPAQTVQAIPSNARIISYNAPNVPTVVVPTNDDTSYEFSYVVFDENSGDKKAQRELSDGGVVHGEYSFVQPDGYIREVKYTADDLTGFNAVVKSFLPESVVSTDKKSPEIKNKSEPPPCKETKSEAIKLETEQGHEEHLEPSHDEAHELISESQHSEAQGKLKDIPVDHGTINEHAHDIGEADRVISPVESSTEHESGKEPKHSLEHDSESHSEHFLIHITESPEDHAKHGEHHEEFAIQTTVHEEPLPDQAPTEDAPHTHDENTSAKPSDVELIQAQNKVDCVESTHESMQAPNPQVSTLNGPSAYNDIIKCVQAAIASRDGNASNISPLTYILLPAANKPC